jgi:hypothetical protein
MVIVYRICDTMATALKRGRKNHGRLLRAPKQGLVNDPDGRVHEIGLGEGTIAKDGDLGVVRNVTNKTRTIKCSIVNHCG